MKVIIAGSRTINEYALLEQAVQESGFAISEVVSGGARGVDLMGERYSIEHRLPCARFEADWFAHGKKAGPIRNEEMAAHADALIAVWDGVWSCDWCGTHHYGDVERCSCPASKHIARLESEIARREEQRVSLRRRIKELKDEVSDLRDQMHVDRLENVKLLLELSRRLPEK